MDSVPVVYTLPNIEFVGGGSHTFAFNIFSKRLHSPISVGGATCNFSIMRFDSANEILLVNKTVNVPTDAENRITITLSPSDTINLHGRFIYQITIKDAGGIVEPPMQGIIYIVNNINKSFAVGS